MWCFGMSVKQYAVVDQYSVVVNLIVGDLSEAQAASILSVETMIRGAVDMVLVEDGQVVWIGGTYDPESGEYSPPPSPEPEPEPIVEETTNDDAPIE